MVLILLNSIKAGRCNNNELDLLNTRVQTYILAINHTNYIRCVTFCLQDLMNLQEEIVSDFKTGMFAVKQVDVLVLMQRNQREMLNYESQRLELKTEYMYDSIEKVLSINSIRRKRK